MDIDEKVCLALKHHQSGNLLQAENIYKEILGDEPNNVNALHYLGILFYQLKNYNFAIEYIKKVLELNPTADAYYNLGNVYKDTGQFSEAITCFQKSLELNPNNPDAYNNKGIIYKDKRLFDEAISCFQKALQNNPEHVIAYYNLAVVYKNKRLFDEAISCFQKALEFNPNIIAAYYNLGAIFQEKGQLDDAIAYYQKAIRLNPNLADLYCNLGTALQKKGQLDEAIEYYQKAIELNPNLEKVYNEIGIALRKKGQLDKAIEYYQKAIAIDPNLVETYNNLGVALYEKGLLSEAIKSYHRALSLRPNYVEAYYNIGKAYHDHGYMDKAERFYRRALTIKPDFFICYSNLLMLINYKSDYDTQKIFSEHLCFAKQFAEPLYRSISSFDNVRLKTRRLKIGYVSPDFRRHAVSYFSEPVIIRHNREYFEVFCYSNNPAYDEVTQRIQENADKWRNIVGISDEDVTELIQKDKIDILIDLAGHTADNRILVFAQKPAPIQISWIGYLATTGLSTMDYKIADNYTDPPGKTEQYYTEKLLRLPKSFLCYLPDRDAPDVGKLPALSVEHITFGSFNNFSKMTSEVFSLWAKILKELTDSRLILKGKSFHDKTTCQYALDMFKQRDIASQRIILQPHDQSPKHLESYNQVDIGLDTFPFNGAATTCEAMWMGVPVITLAGTAYHSRVGVSLLSNVGLSELVAKTSDQYISIAVNLAKDLKRLKSLRENLRNMMTYSPLCDLNRFTENLEICYSKIWETWCESV